MKKEEILEYLGEDWNATIGIIGESLLSDIGLLRKTNDELLSHPGKRLRPMLSLLMARACGKECNPDSIKYAAASELLHNATLFHDDVADDSTERRGLPTVNANLGSNAAVLLGDFWLARAVQMVFDAEKGREDVARIFAETLVKLAEGEMLQLEKAEHADTTEEDYIRIVYCKTAALFEAACVSAALSVDAPEQYVSAAREYAIALGIAFQIKDDILDYGSSEELGKPVGSDLKERKITLPLLCAIEGSALEGEIRACVKEASDKMESLERVRGFVESSDGIGKAAAILDRYIGKAIDALSVLPDTHARKYLEELARFNSYRKS